MRREVDTPVLLLCNRGFCYFLLTISITCCALKSSVQSADRIDHWHTSNTKVWLAAQHTAGVDDLLLSKLDKASCPPDRVPYYVRKLPKPCSKKHPRPCPGKVYTCYEDIVVNVTICCGKVDGCQNSQPQINTITNQPVMCYLNKKTNSSKECQTPYQCQESRPGGRIGFCCPSLPMPIPTKERLLLPWSRTGCPEGTTEIKYPEGRPLQCKMDQPKACPGNATCYVDSFDGFSKCCGPDRDDECPDGFKLMKMGDAKVTCSDEIKIASYRPCPQGGQCHRSGSGGGHYCCEPDNGCPSGTVPILEANVVRKCSKNVRCPSDAICEYDTRTNQSQCCKRESPTGRCPGGYVSVSEAKRTNAIVTGPETCDESWRGCVAPSICLRAVAVAEPQIHNLCCFPIPKCPHVSQMPYPEHENPKPCSPVAPHQCPVGYNCEESTLSSVHICCSAVSPLQSMIGYLPPPLSHILSGKSLVNPVYPTSPVATLTLQDLSCPEKFLVQREGGIICNPNVVTSCNAGSRCLPANKPGYFVCCTPTSPLSKTECTPESVFIWRQNDGPQTCNPNYTFTGCPQTHPLCLFYPPIGRHSCCRASICPNGHEPFWTLGTTVPRHCGNVGSGECPVGYSCLYSSIFEANVCCWTRPRASHIVGNIGGHLTISPSNWFTGNLQEQRRMIAPSPWNQLDGDFGLPSGKK